MISKTQIVITGAGI